jgi:hypothetical protein
MYINYYTTCFDTLGVIIRCTIPSVYSSLQRDVHFMSLCCGSRSWSWGTVRCGSAVVNVHKVLRGRKSLLVLANIRNRMQKTTIKALLSRYVADCSANSADNNSVATEMLPPNCVAEVCWRFRCIGTAAILLLPAVGTPLSRKHSDRQAPVFRLSGSASQYDSMIFCK